MSARKLLVDFWRTAMSISIAAIAVDSSETTNRDIIKIVDCKSSTDRVFRERKLYYVVSHDN